MLRLVVLASLIGGCAHVMCSLDHDKPSAIDQCEANFELIPHESAKARFEQERREDQAQRSLDGERVAYAAAIPDCDRGDAHACLTVAVYSERHGGAPAQIGRDYGVACRGNLGFGCYGAGRYERDPSVAAKLLARGCELGETASCDAAAAAATAAPARSTELNETACRLGNYDACERAGFAFVHGAGVPVDRVRGEALLVRGCDHGNADACAQLGRAR